MWRQIRRNVSFNTSVLFQNVKTNAVNWVIFAKEVKAVPKRNVIIITFAQLKNAMNQKRNA